MVAVVRPAFQPIRTSLEGEFLITAKIEDHYLTCTESGLANALFVARRLARDGWKVRIQGQDEDNTGHSYDIRP